MGTVGFECLWLLKCDVNSKSSTMSKSSLSYACAKTRLKTFSRSKGSEGDFLNTLYTWPMTFLNISVPHCGQLRWSKTKRHTKIWGGTFQKNVNFKIEKRNLNRSVDAHKISANTTLLKSVKCHIQIFLWRHKEYGINWDLRYLGSRDQHKSRIYGGSERWIKYVPSHRTL